MSLKIWLPLIESKINQGLIGNLSFSIDQLTQNANGKLGKCYGGAAVYNTNQNIIGNSWTISMWVKSSSWGVNNDILACKNVSSSDHCQFYFSIINGATFNIGVNAGSSSLQYSYTFATNTWYHLAATYDGKKCVMYINGNNVKQGNITNSLYTDCTNIGIGCRSTNTSGTSITGQSSTRYFNDVRFYDEALSPKEIKNISRGLVCNYTLNRNGFGQDNLILTSQSVTSGGNASGITRTYESDGTMKIVAASGNGNYASLGFQSNSNTNVGNNLSVGDTYTISVDVKVASGTNLPTLFINSGNSYKQLQGNIVLNQWIRAYYTSVWAEPGSTYGNISLHLGFSSAIGTYYFRNFKLEKGSTATPWTPAPSDDLYSQIGLDSNVENDVSGYGNNGTRIGTFSWSGDTPRYGCSTIFNGIDNAIQTPNLTTMITDKNYTISCWTYKTVIGTKNYQTIYGGPSGFELEARNGSGTDPLFRIHNWGGGTTPYVFGEWTHFCFVHTDSDSKLYINGELKITGSSVNIPSGNYYIGAWKVATSQNYDGLMSDFRIYATALSEEDVLELYHAPISLSNNGTLMTQGEYVEV